MSEDEKVTQNAIKVTISPDVPNTSNARRIIRLIEEELRGRPDDPRAGMLIRR